MKTSENLSEIFKALSKFQGELENAPKSSQGHGYKYADLATCINEAKPVLAKNGLAVVQMLGGNSDEERTLITMLTHESGEYISSEFVMAKAVLSGGSGKNPAQVLGSAITYHRRYAYAAIIGLAQDDDDATGNTTGNDIGKNKKAQAPPQKKYTLTFDTFCSELEPCQSPSEVMTVRNRADVQEWYNALPVQHKKAIDDKVAEVSKKVTEGGLS